VIGFVIFLLALGGLFLWLGAIGVAALLERLIAPRHRPATLTPGLATVTGTLHALGEPLEAPLSGARCAWWSFSLEERRRGRSGWIWFAVARGATSGTALLRDDDGSPDAVRVDLHDARVSAGPGLTVPAAQAGALTLAQLERLAGLETTHAETTHAETTHAETTHAETDAESRDVAALPPRSRRGALDRDQPVATLEGRWRIVETHLPPGTPVWVSGTARRVGADVLAAGGQAVSGHLLELTGSAGRPLVVSTGGLRRGVCDLVGMAFVGVLIGLGTWFGAIALLAAPGGSDSLAGPALRIGLAVLPFVVLTLVGVRAVVAARRDAAGQRKATGS